VPAEPDTTVAVIIATIPTVAARTRLITSSIHETFRLAISCLYYAYRLDIVSAILCGVSPVVTDVLDPVLDDVLDIDVLERAWQGTSDFDEKSISKINKAQLTITRNAASDFQDRQVYLYVDGELWGKVKYGRPMSREIPPGHHSVRAFNTLFSHTIEVDAKPGEHVKLRCTNCLGRGGWIMMVIWQIAALRVRLEREF